MSRLVHLRDRYKVLYHKINFFVMSSSKGKKRKASSKVDDDISPKQAAANIIPNDLKSQFQQARETTCKDVSTFKFNKKRVKMITKLKDLPEECASIMYWMLRDHRVEDNWALLYAQKLALAKEVPLVVCFCLPGKFLDATYRQYDFMLKGLKEVQKDLKALNIGFTILKGAAPNVLPNFIKQKNVGGIVVDFLPLRLPTEWLTNVQKNLAESIPICQVDAHNIVPCWEASNKQEYGARTIRPKITKLLTTYLTQFPPVIKHPHSPSKEMLKDIDWKSLDTFIEVDRSIQSVKWATPGTSGGLKILDTFCSKGLKYFASQRNDPTKSALSNLSPWLHAGHLSAQRVALHVREFRSSHSESVAGFLEEMIIRRELADNFCFYNPDNYDSINGAFDWAKKTLELHTKDKREYLYSKKQLENGETHDDLWNATQIQLLTTGKIHGFLRMYWAKKILEWTESPEVALQTSIYLNDRYELDGIDPNGYVGCMWSICGIHDQGWGERAIFGKIRFMNYKGCKRKFDVAAFVSRYPRKSLKT